MPRVCLSTMETLRYPQGGHLWVFMNWALGFKACGCEVVWLSTFLESELDHVHDQLDVLRRKLEPFGLDQAIAVEIKSEACRNVPGLPALEEFGTFDLLFDMSYGLPYRIVRQARRTALIDIDPARYQFALKGGQHLPPVHDVLFTIGENIAGTTHTVPDGSRREWVFTAPCVYLGEWPAQPEATEGCWTTVTHWWGAWMEDAEGHAFSDAKRDGFAPFLGLPAKIPARFEVATNLDESPGERQILEAQGFAVRDPYKIAADPDEYRRYIQSARGEFSPSRPSYVRLNTGWVSDRTLCFLASGKPCIVEDTGYNRCLAGDGGLHRFRDIDSAVGCFERVLNNYAAETRLARTLAEEHFSAEKVCRRVLTLAL